MQAVTQAAATRRHMCELSACSRCVCIYLCVPLPACTYPSACICMYMCRCAVMQLVSLFPFFVYLPTLYQPHVVASEGWKMGPVATTHLMFDGV